MKDNFFKTVYRIVAQIPAGRVATYGQIAALAGSPRAARQVGTALRRVPVGMRLPCHRVVNRFGELSPAYVFGAREYQRTLLEEEGVTFLPDGAIDLRRHLWDPDVQVWMD